jgi:hypothetical protein
MGWWRIQWFFSGFVNFSHVFDMFWCVLICFLWHFIGVDSPPGLPSPKRCWPAQARGRAGEPRPWEFTETLMQPKLRQRRLLGPDWDPTETRLGPLGWWRGWWYVTTCYPLVMSK